MTSIVLGLTSTISGVHPVRVKQGRPCSKCKGGNQKRKRTKI